MAGLFVLLHAFFLAAVQVLVYAGAVMVLFLFVIMLLDLKEEERRKDQKLGLVAGLISVGAQSLASSCEVTACKRNPAQNLPAPTAAKVDQSALGKSLFYAITCLPFEIVSILLLVAMVGVILALSKKRTWK